MSVTDRLRTVLCGAVLEIGALTGIPMRPEQICELMRTLNQPKIAHTLPERPGEGDDGAEAPWIRELRSAVRSTLSCEAGDGGA